MFPGLRGFLRKSYPRIGGEECPTQKAAKLKGLEVQGGSGGLKKCSEARQDLK